MKKLVEFDRDYKRMTFLNAKKGQIIYLSYEDIDEYTIDLNDFEVEYMKPQYVNNIVRFTQGEHEGGAYDLGEDNQGIDHVYAPFDGKIIFEGYAKELGYQGKYGEAICAFILSDKEVSEGKKALVWVWHLSYSSENDGDSVKRNQVIGHEGNTGYSFGAHTHVGMAIVPNDWKWEKKIPSEYKVDYVDNTWVYPHQRVIKDDPNGIYDTLKDRIQYVEV